MNNFSTLLRSGLFSIAWVLIAFAAPVSAQSMYGSLSKFDVFNDTGQDCHGFEIELDGISSKDVVYEFASPNSQYPTPKLTDFAGGVYVDYESPYDKIASKWINTTIVPPKISPTLGHQCWFGQTLTMKLLAANTLDFPLPEIPAQRTTAGWLLMRRFQDR